jgi:hypothetical protein
MGDKWYNYSKVPMPDENPRRLSYRQNGASYDIVKRKVVFFS